MKASYKITKTACYFGYIIQAVVNNLTALLFVVFNAEPYGISLEKLGRLIFVNFIAQLVIDALSVYIVPRIGYKRCVLLAQFCSGFGYVLMAVLPFIVSAYIGIMLSIIVLAIGSGFIEVLISPIIEALPTENKAGNMSLLHSFYCWGQVLTVTVTTLILLVIGRKNWFILPLFWSVLPFVNTFLFSKAEIVELKTDESNFKTPFAIFKNKSFCFYVVLMLCGGASELAMAQWSSFFVEVGFSVDKWLGDLFGPCMFAAFMGIGRILFAGFSKRVQLDKVLMWCALLCVICYLLVGFSNSAVLGIIGCAVCGLSVSVMWPGTLSLGAKKFASSGTVIFSLLAIFGDLGCALGPWILGIVADFTQKNILWQGSSTNGMQFGFITASVFPLIMFIVLLVRVIYRKRKEKFL